MQIKIFFLITGYVYVALPFQTNILKCQHLIKPFLKELFGVFSIRLENLH